MDLNTAYKIIEKVHGFNDETSAIGEAWAYIKQILDYYAFNYEEISEIEK